MKIAVVGSGISGLTAAYELSRHHEVHLIEAAPRLGGHTNTIEVSTPEGRLAVDTGFIVFNDRTYPHFCRMMDSLGVASRPTSMSFSVRCDATGLEYAGTNLRTLFAQRRNLLRPSFYAMLLDILRFNRRASLFDVARDLTIEEYFHQHRHGRLFLEKYFYPMAAAIWSCPRGRIAQFPMQFLIEFYRHHGLLQIRDRPEWRVIEGGSREYIRAMLDQSDIRVRTSSAVLGVERQAGDVALWINGRQERFDHAIIACHADQALRLLADQATTDERRLLGAFPYEANEAVLHTDWSVLPRNPNTWSSWNYRIPAAGVGTNQQPPEKPIVTYNMNILQHLEAKEVYCVTLNGGDLINPQRIIQRIPYAHPVFDAQRWTAQQQHARLIQHHGLSYCGAYWGNGFHEDGVVSALAVCDAFRGSPPQAIARPAVAPGARHA